MSRRAHIQPFHVSNAIYRIDLLIWRRALLFLPRHSKRATTTEKSGHPMKIIAIIIIIIIRELDRRLADGALSVEWTNGFDVASFSSFWSLFIIIVVVFRLDDHFSLSENMQFIHWRQSVCVRFLHNVRSSSSSSDGSTIAGHQCIYAILAATGPLRHVRSNTQDKPYHSR